MVIFLSMTYQLFFNISPIKQLSFLLILVTFFMHASFVYAVDECGVIVAGGTVTCNNDGSPASDVNPYASGIRYNIPNITVNLDNITVNRPTGDAVILDGDSPQPLILNALGTVDISTGAGFGIGIQNDLGAATINYNDGAISTGTGTFRVAVYARANANDAAIINYNNGSIVTTGDYSYSVNAWTGPGASGDVEINYQNGDITSSGLYVGGPYGRALGDGNSTIIYSAGTITSSGGLGFGMLAQTDGAGDARVDALSGTINTSGVWATAVHAYAGGLGKLDINVGAGLQADTTGSAAWGVLGTIAMAANSQPLTINNSGLLTTTGDDAHGIWAWNNGSGTTTIQSSNDLSATGLGSDGIRAEAANGGLAAYQVDVISGTIQSGSGAAAGVHTTGVSGGAATIHSAAIVDGALSGMALLDGIGDIVATNLGVLTGDIILHLGNDEFNLVDGSLTGDIYGDDTTTTVNDGDDTFSWTGGDFTGSFNGQNGSDQTIISAINFDGSQSLDGGDDLSIGDGWVDALTFQSISSSITAASILNWEAVNLDGSSLLLTDNIWSIGDGSVGSGLHLVNNSVLDISVAGLTLNGNLINEAEVDMQDDADDDVLQVNGDYSGMGTIKLDTELNDGLVDNSDFIHITGNNSAVTQLEIKNLSGAGADTGAGPLDGILIVQVDDLASTGTFVLAGVVSAGGYFYSLVQNAANGNWYLQSALIPIVPTLNFWVTLLLILLLIGFVARTYTAPN